MTTTINSASPTSAYQNLSTLPSSSSAERTGEAGASGATGATSASSAREQSQTQLNVAIVQSSMSVSLKSGNEPLALLYKSAINSLNETLQADLGDNAIQNAAGQDNSPEATAQRIVQLSTGFFEAYKQQHPGVDEATNLKQFMSTIKSGFEKGYKEASDILGSLNVLKGDIATNVQKTYDLVQKGYADFEAAHGSPDQQQGTANQQG
ncbi:MAG: DUF5610 domain-containing protein [Burkholderiales bacterium]|nr:DUF5610 domain-containing protein [Burkholderiales bacterium]